LSLCYNLFLCGLISNSNGSWTRSWYHVGNSSLNNSFGLLL
jgi:hypothetical protein